MKKHSFNIIQLLMIIGIILMINVISAFFHIAVDFTGDKRYTLTKTTRNLLKEQDDVIYVKVLLDGNFPALYKKIQESANEMLRDFNNINSHIEYDFENPLKGNVEEVNQAVELLRKDGMVGIGIKTNTTESTSVNYIFPYAIFHYGKRKFVVNLLEPMTTDVNEETWINNSISMLEYKFANAIQKLRQKDSPTILFTEGKGELNEKQTARLENKLLQYYQVGRINLDSVHTIPAELDLLIVAKPTQPFSPKNQFLIDQYLMKGGNIIWLIDRLNMNLDSINKQKFYIPEPYPLNLDDLWFKYGIRILPNLVQDLSCTRIPQVVGIQGNKPQIESFDWYYHLLVDPEGAHPIVSNLDKMNLYDPSSIDTIQTSTRVKKTILLKSSKYSRFQLSPARVTFEILKYPPEVDRFNKPHLPLAVLLEGEFESYFRNKLSQGTKEMLQQIKEPFREKSEKPGKMIFVSDGDFIKNLYDSQTDKISPIGFNKWVQYTFIGNEDFITNSVEYMVEKRGVISARSKKVKFKMLDTIKATNEMSLWQMVNIGIPLLFLIAFGLGFNYYRRRRYAS
ncbi:MAG TPA: gliding motility-associated ABC transporter substrate-binding protein GldG [Saprospiraceae bacterium]|nr:gliding motility-associated ABC transporter substrate-binding protein GldG [Saprospiraceae bacterium]